MLARLGYVVYWLACAVAILFGAMMFSNLVAIEPAGPWQLFLLAAVLIFAGGRAIRFILAGN